MYNRMAQALTKKMVSNKIIDAAKFDVYAYGLEILIAYIGYFAVFYFIAFITKTVLESTVFCLGFIILRRFSGGFHASTYLRCHMLFAVNHLAFILLLKLLPTSIYPALFISVPGIAFILIWIFAPVDHENRRFNNNEYSIFKKRSRIYAILVILLTLLFARFPQIDDLLISYLIGVFSATISIVAGYIQQRLNFNN